MRSRRCHAIARCDPIRRSAAMARCGIRAQGVAGIEVSGDRSVDRHPQARDAGLGGSDAGGEGNEQFREQRFVAEDAVVSVHDGSEAAAGHDLHVGSGRPGQSACRARDRRWREPAGDWTLFGRRGHAQQIVLGKAPERVNRFQHRPADGERAGFVQNDDVKMREPLQRFAAFEEHAKLRAAAHGHGERGGHGQAHGARAGDDEHGDRIGQGQLKGMRWRESRPRR